MRHTLIPVTVLLLAFSLRLAAEEGQVDLKPLVPMVENAMKGYNAHDHKVYFADFAKMVAPVTTEDWFKKFIVDGYFAKWNGKLLGLELDPKDERNVLKGPNLVVVFKAKFEKRESKIRACFMKEADAWKIQSIDYD
jgi:hypothetical protein